MFAITLESKFKHDNKHSESISAASGSKQKNQKVFQVTGLDGTLVCKIKINVLLFAQKIRKCV